MHSKREYIMAVCFSDSSGFHPLRDAVKALEEKYGGKNWDVSVPPPSRDVRIQLKMVDGQEWATWALKRHFGFTLTSDLILKNHLLREDVMALVDGLSSRVARENGWIEYFGLKIIVLAHNASDADLLYLYALFKDKCELIGIRFDIDVSFDVACSKDHFDYILANEHCRIVHGDIQAQCAAARNSPWT